MAISYSESAWKIRSDLAECHESYWARLASPGSWWTGAQRVALAAEVRAAGECSLCGRRKQALSPYGIEGEHDRASRELSAVAVDVAHRITTDASRLTREWFDRVLEQGLSAERYVEIVGTVVAVVSIDSFCRAIGVPLHALPEPRGGEPNRYRPASASQEEAWVPVVPADNTGTPEADLWPAKRTGWVVRAMSLVPDEVRTLADLSAAHYLPHSAVIDPRASRGALSRAQIELIAGRVSALNECFY